MEGEGEEKEEIIEEEPGLKLVFPPMPENTWKPEPEVTSEKLGSGANAKVKKLYRILFVCIIVINLITEF